MTKKCALTVANKAMERVINLDSVRPLLIKVPAKLMGLELQKYRAAPKSISIRRLVRNLVWHTMEIIFEAKNANR